MRKLSTQCMDDLEKKVKSAPEAKSSPAHLWVMGENR